MILEEKLVCSFIQGRERDMCTVAALLAIWTNP